MQQRCIGFDRIIETDHPIVGTLEPCSAGHDEDVIRICRTSANEAWPDDRPLWSFDGDILDFDPPGIARYRCTPSSIVVEPLATAPSGMVDALLIATALPAILWMQAAFVLHASAVVPADHHGALAIAGRSGSGKSRLAAAFMARRARLVADDSIAIRRTPSGPNCSGLAGGYHLGASDAEERPFHAVPRDRACGSAPLSGIVILDDEAATPVRLGAIDAVEALLINRHRASVPRRCGLEPRALRDAALLAQAVPIYRWPRNAADALLDDDVRRAVMRDRGDV